MVAALALFGCSGGDDEHGGEGPICSELSELCHDADEAGVEGAEHCHHVAHAADEAACEAELESCRAICESAPGDTAAR